MQSDRQYVLNKLKASIGKWPAICQETGITYSWITKFAQGRIPSPGFDKIETLTHYFKAREL